MSSITTHSAQSKMHFHLLLSLHFAINLRCFFRQATNVLVGRLTVTAGLRYNVCNEEKSVKKRGNPRVLTRF